MKNGWLGISILCLLCGVTATADAQPRASYQQTQYQGQEIGKLTGDVYYARMDDYVSVFMVTTDGIVLVEPIGTEMATWLKGELNRRFKLPVRVRHLQPFALGSRVRRRRLRGHGPLHRPREPDQEHRDAAGGYAAPAARCARRTPTATAASKRGRRRATSRRSSICTMPTRTACSAAPRSYAGPIANVRPPDLTYTDRLTLTFGAKRVEIIWKPTRARRRQHHRPLRRRHQRAVCVGLDHRAPAAVRPDRRRRDGRRENDRGDGLRALRLQPRDAGQEGRRDGQHPVPGGAQGRRGRGDRRRADTRAGAGERSRWTPTRTGSSTRSSARRTWRACIARSAPDGRTRDVRLTLCSLSL